MPLKEKLTNQERRVIFMADWIYRELKLFIVSFGSFCKCIVLFIGEFNDVFHNVYALKCRTEGRFMNYKLECTREEYLLACFDVLLTVHLSIFISVINQLDAQNLFHIKFYFMPLHVSSTCAHHQEVRIVLHSLWYHHTYKYWDKFTHTFLPLIGECLSVHLEGSRKTIKRLARSVQPNGLFWNMRSKKLWTGNENMLYAFVVTVRYIWI